MLKKFLKDFFEVDFNTRLPKNREHFNEIVLKVNDIGGHVFATNNKEIFRIVCKLTSFFKLKKVINEMLKEEKDSA